MSIPDSPRAYFLLPSALAALLLFPGLHRGGLRGYDDALYAHEAKEMLRSGDWRNIRFNGDLNFEYPPLFIWLEAASMRVLGINDFAAKLPAALCGLGTLLVLYGIALELRQDTWFAALAMLVLASTQPFLKQSTHAMTDVPFTLFFAMSVFFYLKGLRSPKYLLLMGIAVGCAILTRSVLGILPLVVIIGHLLATARWRVLAAPHLIGGVLIAIGIPLLWFGAQYLEHGVEFVYGHLAFVSRKVEGESLPAPSLQVMPYVKDLLKYYWPWLPVFLAGLVFELRRSKTALAPLWIFVVLIPLTQVSIPYGRYLMPAYPAMAIVCAVALDRWIPTERRGAYFLGACTILAAVGLYTIVAPPDERGQEIRALAPVAETSGQPGERLLLYTYGERRYDVQNELLWYTDLYTDQIVDMDELVAKHVSGAVGVIDKLSFAQMPGHEELEVLAESQQFYCYRVPER